MREQARIIRKGGSQQHGLSHLVARTCGTAHVVANKVLLFPDGCRLRNSLLHIPRQSRDNFSFVSHWCTVLWMCAFNKVGPVHFLGLNNEFAIHWLPILSWLVSYYKSCPTSTCRL